MRRPATDRTRRARAATLLVAGIAIAACGGKPAPPAMPPPEVVVAPAETRDVSITSEWVGTTFGLVTASIVPKVQGYLLEQNYANGRFVKKGQLLFTIDPRQFQAALDQAKGELGRAQAELGRTEIDVKRFTPLVKQGAVSQQELDNATQQNYANMAAVAQAKAAVEQAALNLEWTKVYAPIDGVVAINTAQIGDLVGTATVLTTMSTLDPIKVQFPISEQEYLRYASAIAERGDGSSEPPKQVTMVLSTGETYEHPGRVSAADRQVDPRTGTITIQALFPNPDNILRPGQFALIKTDTDVLKGAVVVPQRAVVETQGAFSIYTVGPDGRAVSNSVTPGPRTGSDWVISQGLAPGAQVIVEGVEKVRAGIPVKVVPAKPGDAPGMILPSPTAAAAKAA
ncbi:MAG: efflux RND transporter periplasmic adaptor subunit [Alphaproteobacteria bacterium]